MWPTRTSESLCGSPSAEEGFFKQRRTSMQRAAAAREDAKRKRSASAERAEATDGPASPGGGGDARRRKWTRLLLRELYDLGFHASAESLEREARVQLRSDAMKALERHVRARRWDAALALVAGGAETPRLAMKSPAAAREAALMLLRRKYIDLLVKRELRAALQTFQEEISAAYELTEDETKQLAMLLLCTDAAQVEQLVAGLPWKEADMLARVEQLVSPEEIIPEGALQRLVSKDLDIEERAAPQQLQGKVIGECTEILMQHTNDVWELAFSPDGKFLASSSRDGSIVIWELAFKTDTPTNELSLQTVRVRRTLRSLEGDVESLAWSPNSESLLCCGSRSNIIQLWSVETEAFDQRYEHPAEGVASVKWLPNGNQFISGSADKMLILWNAVDGTILYQWSGRRVLDVAVHPKDGRVFALMPSNEIYIYDPARRTDELFYEGDHLISCISLSSTGQYLLVNLVRHEEMVCLDVDSDTVVARYRGLQEQRYVIRPCFAGNQDEVVVSGSEDGRVLLWIRENGKLLTSMDGHSSVVNVVQCHPVHRNIVASASDDETIRVWRLTSHHV